MSMGHKKTPEKLVYNCKKCGKELTDRDIVYAPRHWKKTTMKSWWNCPCGERVLVKGSGHKVTQ